MPIRFINRLVTTWLLFSLFNACAPVKPAYTPMMGKNEFVEWLLMTTEEQARFQEIETPKAQENFIEEFWQRRNPHPGSPVNDLREEISSRVDFCNNWFRESPSLHPGWYTDRGRIYIVLGPPDARERQDAPYGAGSGIYRNKSYERWTYQQHALTLYFVNSQTFGGYRLEMPPLSLHRILESVKNAMLNGQSSQLSSLTVTTSRRSGRIDITLQIPEIYFEEQDGAYIARFKLVVSREEKGEREPTSLPRIIKMESSALLKSPTLTLSILEHDLSADLMKRPLIIQIEDEMSHKRAIVHLAAPKTTGE